MRCKKTLLINRIVDGLKVLILVGLGLGIIVISIYAVYLSYEIEKEKTYGIYIDGTEVYKTKLHNSVDDVVCMPVKEVFNNLNYELRYISAQHKLIVISTDGITYELSYNDGQLDYSGKYFPVWVLSDVFGLEVSEDDTNNIIWINTKKISAQTEQN